MEVAATTSTAATTATAAATVNLRMDDASARVGSRIGAPVDGTEGGAAVGPPKRGITPNHESLTNGRLIEFKVTP